MPPKLKNAEVDLEGDWVTGALYPSVGTSIHPVSGELLILECVVRRSGLVRCSMELVCFWRFLI